MNKIRRIEDELHKAELMINRAVYEIGRCDRKYAMTLFNIAAVFLDRASEEVRDYACKRVTN